MKTLKNMQLTIAVLLCSISARAYDFKVNGIYYDITSSLNLKVEVTYEYYCKPSFYSPYAGEVVIPETVEYNDKTYSVTSIGRSAFRGRSGLTSITIPNSITRIGNYAFEGCSGLTSITIPNSVTYIERYAFEGCSGLTSVHITDLAAWCGIGFGSSTSNPLYFAEHLYLNGKEIKDLEIPESVTSIGYSAFRGYSGLTSITIPESVTSMGGYVFADCI